MATPENTEILDYLREQFARVHRRFDAIETWQREFAARVTALEHQVADMVATEARHYASLSERLDNLTARVERIERRLELVD